jgi:hypothetical protein
MLHFLRRNWIYIAVPLALIVAALGIFLLFFADDPAGPGVYHLY